MNAVPHRLARGVALAAALVIGRSHAADPLEESPGPARPLADTPTDESWAAHFQFTNVTQRHPRLNSPYAGTNSLGAIGRTDETSDITAYLGARLWTGAEFWVDPEVDQGFGFDKTVGLAGFSSGEAYKIGANAPYLRMPRLFLRQTISLGGDDRATAASANQLAGTTTGDHLVFTVGKFSVVDVFDTNRYAHDPRVDFLNWSIIDAGPFDYAADAWGFTYGGTAEWTRGAWTTRIGLFQLSPIPNGKIVAVDFSQRSYVAEVERRHDWFGGDGAIRLTTFVNRGRMGGYADAVALAQQTNTQPDTSLVRKPASRSGAALNVEQVVAKDVGLFVRAGIDAGGKEAYEFTEINRSIAAGLSFGGGRWQRSDDVVGVAAVVNQLSQPARAYFAAGGNGILIGDGRLDYGNEKIFETYYSMRATSFGKVTFDYQHIANPAYNRDRGPVSVYTGRLHLEY